MRGAILSGLVLMAWPLGAQPYVPYTIDYAQGTAGEVSEARRSDGTVVVVRSGRLPWGKPFRSRVLLDAPRGLRVAVDDLTKSTTSMRGGGEALSGQRCSAAADAPMERIAGYWALRAKVSETTDSEGVTLRAERWAAPELGCAELKRTLTRVYPDGRSEELSRKVAVRVLPGEPDPELFRVPRSYVERSPSEAMRELRRRVKDLPPVRPETEKLFDEAYEASRIR
jgi:hypothetical protein